MRDSEVNQVDIGYKGSQDSKVGNHCHFDTTDCNMCTCLGGRNIPGWSTDNVVLHILKRAMACLTKSHPQ